MTSRETDTAPYLAQSPLSNPRTYAAALDGLSHDLSALCAQIQMLLIHRNWAAAYHVELGDARMQEAHKRSLSAILERVFELDARPLNQSRPPESRFAGTCRDFAMLLCASLRHQGVPARMRCGFGSYFAPGQFEDHWVCEHWDADADRWVLTDAQIDALQHEVLKLDFDPLDVPRDRFLVAGDAWQRCRSGADAPDKFGIFDMRGMWFVRGNVMRDLAALNRVELLPWDAWGLLLELGNGPEKTPQQTAMLDQAADLSRKPSGRIDAIQTLYRDEPLLRVAGEVLNALTGRSEAVAT